VSNLLSWDDAGAEERYRLEQVHEVSAEQLFERHWAFTLTGQVLDTLQREYAAGARGDVFAALQSFLTGETGPGSYAQAAGRLNMTEGAVKVALHRLRRRFGTLLRAEVAHTVARPEEIDEELRHLFSAIAG
jgi:hypothetical protein